MPSFNSSMISSSTFTGWIPALSLMVKIFIWDYRLSRALVAAFCGAGLALCGAVMQALLGRVSYQLLSDACLAVEQHPELL